MSRRCYFCDAELPDAAPGYVCASCAEPDQVEPDQVEMGAPAITPLVLLDGARFELGVDDAGAAAFDAAPKCPTCGLPEVGHFDTVGQLAAGASAHLVANARHYPGRLRGLGLCALPEHIVVTDLRVGNLSQFVASSAVDLATVIDVFAYQRQNFNVVQPGFPLVLCIENHAARAQRVKLRAMWDAAIPRAHFEQWGARVAARLAARKAAP